MTDDFRILRPPKPPLWRDPKRRPKEIGIERFVLATLSLVAGVLTFVPSKLGTLQPISLDLAMGNKPSWVLFGLLGLALLYLAAKFLGASLHLNFCLCLLAVAALATIAFTNPFSAGHLLVFGGLCCMIPVWLMGLHLDLGGWKLPSAAALCIVGICTCTANLGIGERIVLLGALFGLNSVFYEHVLV